MAAFFRTADAFRVWLAKNHDAAPELLVGFYKKGTGKPSIAYPEALDEALCFGWIDGIRHGGDDSYTIRFSPRKADSKWSLVNIQHAKRLIAAGRMTDAGLKAYDARDEKAAAHYSYEARTRSLDSELERRFRANRTAWSFFAAQPAGYKRTVTWWVVSAKREETRQRRLQTLIDACAKRLRIDLLTGRAAGSRKTGRGRRAT